MVVEDVGFPLEPVELELSELVAVEDGLEDEVEDGEKVLTDEGCAELVTDVDGALVVDSVVLGARDEDDDGAAEGLVDEDAGGDRTVLDGKALK